MEIPQSFRLGRTTYTVQNPWSLGPGLAGEIHYKPAVIRVAWVLGRTFKQRTPRQRAETFWHETTHAILHDMGHPLYKNEEFVTEFSRRLNQVVHTARLT